ncbi:MAG: hypothetical protein WDN49_07120 [Acetobacteraceae bacterium]
MTSGGSDNPALPGRPGYEPVAGQANVADIVDEHVRRLDILMEETTAMKLAERPDQANSKAQDVRQRQRLAENAIEGLATLLFKHEHPASFAGQKLP